MNIKNCLETGDEYSTVFRCQSAIHYSPHTLKNTVIGRPRSSFMLVKQGFYRYRMEGGMLEVHDGEILYLPEGAAYSYEVLSDVTECLQFEFTATRTDSGVNTVLCENPCVIRADDPGKTEALFAEVIRCHNEKTDGYIYTVISYMSRIYGWAAEKIAAERQTPVRSRIEPAVRYIRMHFRERIYIAELAALCCMSESQLRRMFAACIGMPPIAYKNSLQMAAAIELLEGGYSIQEIAEIVGVDSVSSFYHMFRKKYGITPAEYMKIAEKKKKQTS